MAGMGGEAEEAGTAIPSRWEGREPHSATAFALPEEKQ